MPASFAFVALFSLSGAVVLRWRLKGVATPASRPEDAWLGTTLLPWALAGILGMAAVRALCVAWLDGVALHVGVDVTLAALAVLLLWAVSRERSGRDLCGAGRRGVGSGLVLGVLGWAALLAPILLVHQLNLRWVLWGDDAPLQGTQEFLRDLDGPARVSVVTILLATAVPLVEETVFRGLLQNGLARRLRPMMHRFGAELAAILASSLVFMLIHPSFTWIPIFVISVGLGALYARTRNLWVCVTAHGAHNLASVLLLLNPEWLE